MKKVFVPALFIALCWALFLGASDPRVGLSSQMPTSVGLSNELSSAMGGSYSKGFWNGHEFAIVITLDDGYFGQLALKDTLDALGIGGTIYFSAETFADSSGAGMSKSEAWAFVSDPDWEIGQTDNIHDDVLSQPTLGSILRHNTLTTAGRDSISAVGLYGGTASDAWIIAEYGVDPVSYAVDGGPMSWSATQVVKNMGYESYRGGSWDNPYNGRYVSYGGEGNWDSYRVLDPTKDSPLYGIATANTEDTDANYLSRPANDWQGAIFNAGAATDEDTMKVRVDAIFTFAAEHGNALIPLIFHEGTWSKEHLRVFRDYVNSNYDVAWLTMGEAVDIVKSKNVAKAPAADTPYAQLALGDTTGYFYGPADPAAATVADDSFLVYRWQIGATPVDTTAYANRITTGHTFGLLNSGADYGRPATTHNGVILGDMPLAGDPSLERIGLMYWDVMTELAGKDIVSAVIGYRLEDSVTPFDYTDVNQNRGFLSIQLLTSSVLYENWDSNAMTYLASYFESGVDTTMWSVPIDSFVVNMPLWLDNGTGDKSFYEGRQFSNNMIAFPSESAGYVERDVTDLLRAALAAGYPAFGLAFNGERDAGGADAWYTGAMNDSDVNQRCYLKIYTAN